MTLIHHAKANLPTKYGNFVLHTFKADGKEHAALVKGNPRGRVLVRIHSECLTGDVFHSLRCDCRAQLEKSLEMISERKEGIVVYLRQEGRDIGLLNKTKAYDLQDKGLDTVEANIQLGFQEDERDYSIAADILKDLGITSICLLTNNPEKVKELSSLGLSVERIPIITPITEHNSKYLETKKRRMGHLFQEVTEDKKPSVFF